METTFTAKIKLLIERYFGSDADEIFEKSYLIQYINLKTKSANNSKARANYGSIYPLYVLVEDYLSKGFDTSSAYSTYEGARFSTLKARQCELPFGSGLQNHALNNRVNSEYQKYFKELDDVIPIVRNQRTNRYWINENLLKIVINGQDFNLAKVIINIIDDYIKTKQDSFRQFVNDCKDLKQTELTTDSKLVETFILSKLSPTVDARLFEIISYAILKYYYYDQSIIWGFSMDTLTTENLKLYKTGKTNANDGGIDFVMKPLGKFFQVTETLDFKKYFLDIDKIQKYPITFVVKSIDSVEDLVFKIRKNALNTYFVEIVVDEYMACIEEIINIPVLIARFKTTITEGYLNEILEEIILQSKVEFNYSDESEK